MPTKPIFEKGRQVIIALFFMVIILVFSACTNEMTGSTISNSPQVLTDVYSTVIAAITGTYSSNWTVTPIPNAESTKIILATDLTTATYYFPGSATPEPPTKTSTKTSTKTKYPTRTKAPTKTRAPTKTPTETKIPPTPVPQDNPIRIFIPSSYSKVANPFHLLAAVIPGAGGNVHMRLTGDGGRTILEKKWIYPNANGRRTTIEEDYQVSIHGVAEAALLTIYTLDNYGRIIALSSEELVLISIGETDIMESTNLSEPFTIRAPYPETSIHHGMLEVRGITRVRTASTIYLELVDQERKIVGSYVFPEVIQPSLEYQTMDVDIPYQVRGSTWVRLIMHQIDIRNGNDIGVSSLLVKLYP